MQPGEYHFVTDSKNALFTDDELRVEYVGLAIHVNQFLSGKCRNTLKSEMLLP